jgi:hypothetical protein
MNAAFAEREAEADKLAQVVKDKLAVMQTQGGMVRSSSVDSLTMHGDQSFNTEQEASDRAEQLWGQAAEPEPGPEADRDEFLPRGIVSQLNQAEQ